MRIDLCHAFQRSSACSRHLSSPPCSHTFLIISAFLRWMRVPMSSPFRQGHKKRMGVFPCYSHWLSPWNGQPPFHTLSKWSTPLSILSVNRFETLELSPLRSTFFLWVVIPWSQQVSIHTILLLFI